MGKITVDLIRRVRFPFNQFHWWRPDLEIFATKTIQNYDILDLQPLPRFSCKLPLFFDRERDRSFAFLRMISALNSKQWRKHVQCFDNLSWVFIMEFILHWKLRRCWTQAPEAICYVTWHWIQSKQIKWHACATSVTHDYVKQQSVYVRMKRTCSSTTSGYLI